MTEREKLMSGQVYEATDPDLCDEINAMKELVRDYNTLRPRQMEERRALLRRMLGTCHDDTNIIQPFYCDFGKHIHVGRSFFSNFNLCILDEAEVRIGDHCFIGPNVSIYTACHSTDVGERNTYKEWAEPVSIGDNVWIGGSVVILPGVTIGSGVTIGAGSVVVHDIPDNCVAVGNPARVVKRLDGARESRCEVQSGSGD